MYFIFAILTSFTVGVLITPVLISILKKAKIGDTPGGRKIHKKFTPSMGGVAIVVSTYLSLSVWAWQFPLPDIRYLLGAIAIMFFVGLQDDLVELSANKKILLQLVAVSLVVVVGDIRIREFHGFLGIDELPIWVSYLFTSFVLLALTNAFNLIDGLDGLASTIGGVSLLILGAWFYVQGLESLALLSFALLGGVLAFIMFNWHPAKIFMGDTGSLTLGFAIGSLVVAFIENNAALPKDAFLRLEPTFTSGIVLMIYPLYDMARVFTRRILKGRHPMTPDKGHVHHFLLRTGLKHNEVALILGGVQIVLIGLVFAMGSLSDNLVLPVLSVVVLLLGSRLDTLTVKRVRRKVIKAPRVLEISAKQKQKEIDLELEEQSIGSGKMNLN